MEQETDYFNEIDEVETAIRAILDNSNFHYLAVIFAFKQVLSKYERIGEKYAQNSTMKDITKYAKYVDKK